MKLRRSKLEIMIAILQAILPRKLNATQIMYHAKISFIQVNAYLRLLVARDLIRQTTSGNSRIYEITEKGKQLLEAYKRVKELAEPPEQ